MLCYSLCWQDPQATQSRTEKEGHVCLFPFPSWAEPLLGRGSLSSFSRRASMGSLCEKMDFLHVLSEYLHQRKLILPFGGGQMSVNVATEAVTHDKFSTDRGSHRCCETSGNLSTLTVISADKVRATLCLQQLVADCQLFLQFLQAPHSRNCLLQFIHCNSFIEIWCRSVKSILHILFVVWYLLSLKCYILQSGSIRVLIFVTVLAHIAFNIVEMLFCSWKLGVVLYRIKIISPPDMYFLGMGTDPSADSWRIRSANNSHEEGTWIM